ncbi:MAG: phosphatidylserine decarboxylase [Thiotrichaceae bacterium]|nr:phosphatidylserine decarboxylase [Thiotrichaceae bacterium]
MQKFKEIIKAYPFYLLPHHLISRLIYKLTRIESAHLPTIIRKFSKIFNINLNEAKVQDLSEFKTFNAFFTRELKEGLRPIDQTKQSLCCPVDGTISQALPINEGEIFQAKGQSYTALELLGGDKALSDPFANGMFTTIYLSPSDYHRIHMPCTGKLTHQIHVPGRLFSVAPFTVNTVPRLFARNERVVSLFDTEYGRMAMVLVGAINVAAIETVWDGLVTPPQSQSINTKTYHDQDIQLNKGEEMGRFNMGSTIVLLMESADFEWQIDSTTGTKVQLGQGLMKSIK